MFSLHHTVWRDFSFSRKRKKSSHFFSLFISHESMMESLSDERKEERRRKIHNISFLCITVVEITSFIAKLLKLLRLHTIFMNNKFTSVYSFFFLSFPHFFRCCFVSIPVSLFVHYIDFFAFFWCCPYLLINSASQPEGERERKKEIINFLLIL